MVIEDWMWLLLPTLFKAFQRTARSLELQVLLLAGLLDSPDKIGLCDDALRMEECRAKEASCDRKIMCLHSVIIEF